MTDQQHAAKDEEPGKGTGSSTAAPEPEQQSAGPGREETGPVSEAGLRKLRRDRGQKMVGGVCAGLGRHYDMDPLIFRIVLAVLSVTGGLGLVFYGFVWLFVPADQQDENEARRLLSGRVDGAALTAVLCALVGCGLFLSMLRNGTVLTFAAVLAVLLVAAAYWSRQRGEVEAEAQSDPTNAEKAIAQTLAYGGAPPEAQAPPTPEPIQSWWREPIVKDGTHVGGTGYLWGPPELSEPYPAPSPGQSAFRVDVESLRTEHTKPRGPRWIGGWVFLLALVAGGVGTGVTWNRFNLATSLEAGLAAALVVFGLGIATSSFLGRTGSGSIFLAVVTAGLLAASAALPSDISTHWARTTWQPATAAAIRPDYELGSGVGTLDLSGVRFRGHPAVSTHVQVGAGQLKVVVPHNATVRLHSEVGIGDIQLPGDDQQDIDVSPNKRVDKTLRPPRGVQEGGTLDMNLEVGLGQVVVARAAS